MNAAYGDKYATSGGLALGFHASVRIRLTKSTKIKKAGTNDVVGINIKFKIIKNRLGPPLREGEIPLYFASGINNVESWLELIKDIGLISGRSILYNNEKITFTKATFEEVVKNTPGLEAYIKDKAAEHIIIKYIKPEDINLDETEITDESILSDEESKVSNANDTDESSSSDEE